MTPDSRFLPQWVYPIRSGWVIWFLLLAGLVGSLSVLVPFKIILVVMGLFLATGVSIFYYRTAFIVFAFVLFAFFDFAGYKPVLISPLKIYLADGIILLMAVLLLRVLSDKAFTRRLASPVTSLLLVNFFFGFFALLIGFSAGHQFNDVMGDFRRFFFYPLATLVALSYPLRRADIRRLIMPFGAALLIISSIALIRVATGETWDPQQFAGKGDFRAIGYFTGIIVLMGIGVVYGFSLIGNRYRKRAFLLMTGLLMAVVLLSNYRLLWVMAAGVPLFVSYSTSRGLKRVWRLVFTMGLVALILIGIVLIVRFFLPEWYLLLAEKFQTRVLGFRFENNIRYYAWKAAWEKFLGSPVFGVGIGDPFRFWALSSLGSFYLSRATTHNIALSLLYQTGVIGGSLFLAIHLRVFWYVYRRLLRVEPHVRAPLAGMLSGYLAALTMGMFQPALESPGSAVGLYLWIGLMLKAVEVFAGKVSPLPQSKASQVLGCSPTEER